MATFRFPDKTTGRLVTLEAKPEPISIDTAKTAVIVVDMQNDFGAKGGMFDRAGIDISMIRSAIGPTARVLTSVRKAGIKVIYLKMAFRADLSDAGPSDSPNWIKHMPLAVGETIRGPDGTESRILIRDMWNTDILSELDPQGDDIVVYKHRPHRHWVYYERVCGVDDQRCNVQRLFVCAASGLYGRADRTRFAKK